MPNDTAAAIFAGKQLAEKWNSAGGDWTMVEDPAMRFAPKYVLYIYNVGPMAFTVAKGSAGPVGGYKIPSCPKGQRFSNPLIIPALVVDTYVVESEIKTHSVSGEFMCQDIVHPMIGQTWSVGQNLDDFGVFWTKNQIPTEEELRAATVKMEGTFRAALAEATMLEATGQLKDITPLMRFAADHFEEDRAWNRIYRKSAECPACGGPTKPGTAVHSCGAVLDWDQAIRFGLRTPEQARLAGVVLNGAKGNKIDRDVQNVINQVADSADGLARSENMAKKLAKPRRKR